MSALGSGMDILFEISGEYIRQIVQNKFNQLGRICYSGEKLRYDLNGENVLIDVRRVVPVLDNVWLSEEEENGSGHIDTYVNLNILTPYGQYRIHNEGEAPIESRDDGWLVMAEDQLDPVQAKLHALPGSDRVLLVVETAELPDLMPQEWLEALGESIEEPIEGRILGSIPLNFLDQTQHYFDEDGAARVLRLLTLTVTGALLKVVGENLVIGVDVDLSQDDEPLTLSPECRDMEPVRIEDGCHLIHHGCGLPRQPGVDEHRFRDDYQEAFLEGSDWGVAFDGHIVDAILRGLPSTRLNEPVTDDCDDEYARKNVCFYLEELGQGVIHVNGIAQVFYCPDEFFLANDYNRVEFEADIDLRLARGRVEVTWRLTAAELWDDVEACFIDIWSKIPEDKKSGEMNLAEIPTSLGEWDGPFGRLSIEDIEVIQEGLILRGSGSIRTPRGPSIVAPDTLRFATGCGDRPSQVRFNIRNDGDANLHLCPFIIHEAEDGDPAHANLFRVVSPSWLDYGGRGRSIMPHELLEVVVELAADPDQVYTAEMDIPNNAERRTIHLIGDFRPAEIGDMVEELVLEHTHYERPCYQGVPAAHPIREAVVVTNNGPGFMEVCRVDFLPENPDGVFSVDIPYVFAETANLIVSFTPGEAGANREYTCTLRIVTNGGEWEVHVAARLIHAVDQNLAPMRGSYLEDFFCADTDWDWIKNSGGLILDVPEIRDIIPLLGGDDCCPPPRGPACLCVDFLEFAFRDVPRGVVIEMLDVNGEVITTNQSRFPTRILMTPIKEDNGYTLRAKIPQSVLPSGSSPTIIRRWLFQQDGLYKSDQRFNDLVVAGNHVYGVGPAGMEVVSLRNLQQPEQVALAPELARASGIAASGDLLLVAKDRLEVYSLINPTSPEVVGAFSPSANIKALLATRNKGDSYVLACGEEKCLYIIDISDPGHPKEISSMATHVQANQILERDNLAFIFGKGGMDIFDLSELNKPIVMGFLPTQQEVRNAQLFGPFALLIYNSQKIDIVDISKLQRLQFAGSYFLESWMGEYTPIAGKFPRYMHHSLILKGDQYGFRLMRMRRNRVDQKKLQEIRDQT